MNKLFENPGATIKSFAKCAFCVLIVATVILAFVNGIETYEVYDRYAGDYDTKIEFHFMAFIYTILAGFSAALVEMVFVYAYGELVENSTYIRKKIELLDNNAGTPKYENVTVGNIAGTPKYENTTVGNYTSPVVIPENKPEEGKAKVAVLSAKQFIDEALKFRTPQGTLGYVVAHMEELDPESRKKILSIIPFINSGNAAALRSELEKLKFVMTE